MVGAKFGFYSGFTARCYLTVEFETCHPSILLLLIIIIIILIIMTAPSSGMVFHAGVALKAGIKYQVPTIWFAWKWELNRFGCTLTMGSSSKCINPPRMLDTGSGVRKSCAFANCNIKLIMPSSPKVRWAQCGPDVAIKFFVHGIDLGHVRMDLQGMACTVMCLCNTFFACPFGRFQRA